MEKVHTAAKALLLVGLLSCTQLCRAQQYGKCGYGKSPYNQNRCSKDSATKRTATAAILPNSKALPSIKLYPNPAGRSFVLLLPVDKAQSTLSVQLYDAHQALVLQKNINAKVHQHTIQLPLLANGTYQVVVGNGTHTQTLLLNIQN